MPAMAALIGCGLYHCVLGSRILGGGALRGGMPWWKYAANRVLTLVENILPAARSSPNTIPAIGPIRGSCWKKFRFTRNSNDFVFDNQFLAQVCWLELHHRRDNVPDEIFQGGLLDQFPSQRRLRVWMPGRLRPFSVGEMGLGPSCLNHHLRAFGGRLRIYVLRPYTPVGKWTWRNDPRKRRRRAAEIPAKVAGQTPLPHGCLLVQPRLALGADPGSGRHSGLSAGVVRRIHLGRRWACNGQPVDYRAARVERNLDDERS